VVPTRDILKPEKQAIEGLRLLGNSVNVLCSRVHQRDKPVGFAAEYADTLLLTIPHGDVGFEAKDVEVPVIIELLSTLVGTATLIVLIV
jgi:hypothetical protein